jgi:hypothetical protein
VLADKTGPSVCIHFTYIVYSDIFHDFPLPAAKAYGPCRVLKKAMHPAPPALLLTSFLVQNFETGEIDSDHLFLISRQTYDELDIIVLRDVLEPCKESRDIFKLEEFTKAIFPSEASFMVKVMLEDDPQNKEGIHWSHKGGDGIDVKIGTFCDMQIVAARRTIFDLLFNR